MANQPHPSPSRPTPDVQDIPGPEEAVFRETFLAKLTRSYEHVAARSFGELLAEMIRDYEGSEREVGESWYLREVRAGAADLRLLEAYFRSFDEQREGNEMTVPEDELCRLGGEIGRELAALAERVEAAVGPPPRR